MGKPVGVRVPLSALINKQKVNIITEHPGKNHLKVILNVEPDDYLGKVNEEIKSLSRKISLDGFRPGKVPPSLTKKMYGNTVLADELNKLISESLTNYIQENDLKVFGQPLPFEARKQSIDLLKPDSYAFGFEMGLIPDFEMASLDQKVFPNQVLPVNDEMIDKEVERLRSRLGEKEYPDVAGDEDILIGRFEELDENGNVKENGINSTSSFSLKAVGDDETKQQMLKLKKEEQAEIDIRKAFGNNEELIIHHILRTDHHAAEHMNRLFRFSLTNIVHVKPAELNQDFFDKVYGAGKVTSESGMREKIREDLEKEFKSLSDSKLDREIQEFLLTESSMDLPKDFLRRLLNESREENQDEMDDRQFEGSLNQIRWELISERLIRENNMEATSDELRNEAVNDLTNYFGASISYLEENPDSFEQMIASLLNDEKSASRLRSRVLNEKIHRLLREKVKTEAKVVNEHEFFHH